MPPNMLLSMPRLLTLHIIRHVLAMTAIVGLAMLAIHSFITLVTEADETGKGGFGVAELLLTTAYQLPSGLALLLPIVAMIGALMGLGSLAAQAELTAMRAAGFSSTRIAMATVIAGALLGGFGWWLSDVASPWGQRAASLVKARAQGHSTVGQTSAWLRDGDSVLRIAHLLAADSAEGLEIYRLNGQMQLQSATSAESAHYQDGVWQLKGVSETHFDAQGHALTAKLPSSSWSGTVTPNVLRLYLLEADAISLAGLRRLIAYLDDNRLDASKYRFQFAAKLVAPITVMVMAFFAVPFAFGSLREAGTGQRLLIGILLGVGFYVANRVTLSLGQIYGWPAFWSAAGPTAMWAVLGAWRIRHIA